MCFSATANFVGSGVLGAVGVVTLTRVKHRRELLFASLPILFAIHQFIEGFVWLGLDGILSPARRIIWVRPLCCMRKACLSSSTALLFGAPLAASACCHFLCWVATTLTSCGRLQLSVAALHPANSIVYINQATNNTAVAVLYVIATCGSLFFRRCACWLPGAKLAILLAVMEVNATLLPRCGAPMLRSPV